MLSPIFALSSWKLVTLSMSGTHAECPSVDKRESARSSVHDTVSQIIAQFSVVPQCGDGLWYTVVSINMSDSTQECPSNWTEISTPVRTCGRPASAGPSCPGVYFSAGSQIRYSKVCGRAIGYQDESTDAFNVIGQSSVDDFYVDGLSITHGGSLPRTHIWTYAVGASDASIND